ncbi:MAG: 2-phosphosulfolactate phosphatase [Bacteroidota bacterium]
MLTKKQIEVCFTPALINLYDIKEKNVVLVDVLRATSAICTAFAWGVSEIIPVGSVEEARICKEKGMIVAGEKDGIVLDFADFGNSPFNFMNKKVKNAIIAYCTTNGTKAIKQASDAYRLIIGSYLNFSSLINFLDRDSRDVLIFCSGWKNRFNLEDTLFAGALSEQLLLNENFSTICDSTHAAVDLWKIAKPNLLEYVQKCAHRERLRKLGLDDVIAYCHTFDTTVILPFLSGNKIIPLIEK